MSRIRNSTAYYDAVERNNAQADVQAEQNEYSYWEGVVRAIIKISGGDGRPDWEKGHEECVRHQKELEAKYGKPRLGFRSRKTFQRNVSNRAYEAIRGQSPQSICLDNIMQFYTPYPTEEDMQKAITQAIADGKAKHEAWKKERGL